MIKKLSLLSFFSALSALFFWGCTPPEVKQNVAQIDSLMTELTKAEAIMTELDISFTDEALAKVEEKLGFIEANLTDTLDRDMALFLSDFSRMRKNLNKLKATHKAQKEQISYSLKQLENLKYDVKNQLTSSEEFNEYYHSEKESVNRVLETSMNYNAWHNSSEKRFAVLDSATDVLVTQIKSKMIGG
jgi:hypothetical protein